MTGAELTLAESWHTTRAAKKKAVFAPCTG